MEMMLGRLWMQANGARRAFPATLDCRAGDVWVEEEALDGLARWVQDQGSVHPEVVFEPQGSTEQLPVHFEPDQILGRVDVGLLRERLHLD